MPHPISDDHTTRLHHRTCHDVNTPCRVDAAIVCPNEVVVLDAKVMRPLLDMMMICSEGWHTIAWPPDLLQLHEANHHRMLHAIDNLGIHRDVAIVDKAKDTTPEPEPIVNN